MIGFYNAGPSLNPHCPRRMITKAKSVVEISKKSYTSLEPSEEPVTLLMDRVVAAATDNTRVLMLFGRRDGARSREENRV